MSALAGTILSDETISSIQASLAKLDTVQNSILTAAGSNDAINQDDGVGSVFRFVRNTRSQFTDPADSDAKEQMPEEIVTIMSAQLAPALAELSAEFESLWESVQEVVTKGGEGEPLVDEFLLKAEADDSALMRVQNALEALQSEMLGSAMDQLSEMLS